MVGPKAQGTFVRSQMETQKTIAYRIHADAPAAPELLARAFGFTERVRPPIPDGPEGHRWTFATLLASAR